MKPSNTFTCFCLVPAACSTTEMSFCPMHPYNKDCASRSRPIRSRRRWRSNAACAVRSVSPDRTAGRSAYLYPSNGYTTGAHGGSAAPPRRLSSSPLSRRAWRCGDGVRSRGAAPVCTSMSRRTSLTLDVRRNSIASSMILPPSDNPKSYHSFSRSLTLKEGVSSFLNGDRYQYCPPRTLTGSWPSSRR